MMTQVGVHLQVSSLTTVGFFLKVFMVFLLILEHQYRLGLLWNSMFTLKSFCVLPFPTVMYHRCFRLQRSRLSH